MTAPVRPSRWEASLYFGPTNPKRFHWFAEGSFTAVCGAKREATGCLTGADRLSLCPSCVEGFTTAGEPVPYEPEPTEHTIVLPRPAERMTEALALRTLAEQMIATLRSAGWSDAQLHALMGDMVAALENFHAIGMARSRSTKKRDAEEERLLSVAKKAANRLEAVMTMPALVTT